MRSFNMFQLYHGQKMEAHGLAPWGFQPLVNGFNGLMYDTFSSYGYVADTAPFGACF